MNKLMMMLVCGAILTQISALGQAAPDPQLQANASNPEVQAVLDQPDGVALTINPDGTFQIFARGSGTYDFNDPDDIKDARRDGTMRAKAHLSKFIKEKISSVEGVDEVSKKTKSLTSDGQIENKAVSKESVKVAIESIRNQSEAILTGVITLKDQKVPHGNGGEIQVTIGISSKTLKAAQKVAQKINQSLQNRDIPAGATIVPTVTPKQNNPSTRINDTDF